MIYLTVERGWPIVGFALGGFLLSAAYTAPPLRLKKHGLGEPTVIAVWGPLMVGGVYYAATGIDPGRGARRVAALRDPLHDRADGQAHRQGAVGRSGRHAHAAGDPRRQGRARRHPGDVPRLLPAGRRARDRRTSCRSSRCSCSRRSRCWPGSGTCSASRSRPSRRCRTRCGRCGSRPHAFLLTRRAGGLLILGMIAGAIFGI